MWNKDITKKKKGLILFFFFIVKIFRYIDVYKFDPVFVYLINNQFQVVICDTGFSGNRQVIELFDHKPSDGIVILCFQMQIQSFIQIIQFGGTFCKIFPFRNDFFKIFLLVGIVFITNLSDDFFE